jgi:hypothetical protein
MIRDSVAEPQETADRLLALRPATAVVIQAAVLVSVLDALILGLLGGGASTMPTPAGEMTLSPFAHAAVLLASLALSAGALQVGGRMLGGKGRFEEALLLVVWLEVVSIAVQAITLVAALILPPLAGLLGLLGVAILLWCLVHFNRALHGFAGLGRTIAALLLGAVVVVLGLSALLAVLGFGGPPDV